MQTPALPAAALPRAVLFMTAPAAPDVPVRPGHPACTLPFGSTSFAEAVLASCAEAGLRAVDLVVSESPEAVRRLVDDGWRWGLTLRWHLAKEADTPYGPLRTLGLRPGDRVLVGHGHRWLASREIRALLAADRAAVGVDGDLAWTGWASFDAAVLDRLPAHADAAMLAGLALGEAAPACHVVGGDGLARADAAGPLLQAQALALRGQAAPPIPATWVRQPWGAMSPDAHVHPEARIEGPVLVGPRCLVEAGAALGPGTVLGPDVLVARGAVVRDTLVLSDTYVGGAVQLEHCVVQGNAVQDLRWDARATLAARDALLAPLRTTPPRAPGWTGRAVAAALALAFALPCAALVLAGRVAGRPAGWRRVEAVRGRLDDDRGLRTVAVREPEGRDAASAWLARWGALLDIAQGRRAWIGVRPRDRGQWFALRRDWQHLFDGQPVGFFQAPAWHDPAQPADDEALAAADAWLVVRTRGRARRAAWGAALRSVVPAGSTR